MKPTVPTSVSLASESAKTATSTPMSFTISYTPLLHPEPAATRSGMNAIQVTQFELSKMLRRAFQQGSEDAKQGYQLELADTVKNLNVQYEDRHFETLNDFVDRMQESTDTAFGEGLSAGIQEERERWESAQAPQADVATQTQAVPTTTSTSSTFESTQMNFPFAPQPTSSSISTQTEPPIQIASESIPSPIPILELPIPNVTASPFNWADNTLSLSTLPLIISKQPRNLSSLRSSLKNPFSSLRHRHHYSKHQKNSSSFRHTQFRPTHPPFHHSPPLTNLEWHRDPRLFELSRVLWTLGWTHP